ncbi:unnamed protein product [Amoebophrya sp. A25]|nr:unnamed protein product [Amoebophrya sp. A25]|eukprot:GSA25T00020548001.1
MARIRKRQKNIARVLNSLYRGRALLEDHVLEHGDEPTLHQLPGKQVIKQGDADDGRDTDADHTRTTPSSDPASPLSDPVESFESQLPDWYCQIESDLYFIPENFERFVKLRHFDSDTPLYLGHVWSTITDKVFGLERTGFSTEVTQGQCVSRAGLRVLAEFYKYFYVGRSEKYKILLADMENKHQVSINRILTSERAAKRDFGIDAVDFFASRHLQNKDEKPNSSTSSTGVTTTTVSFDVKSILQSTDPLGDEEAAVLGPSLHSLFELYQMHQTAPPQLEGDLALARELFTTEDGVLERDLLGGQNEQIMQTMSISTTGFARSVAGMALHKRINFYHGLRFFSVASSLTYLGHMGIAADGSASRSNRVSIDSNFGAKLGYQCLPFQSFVWESYMDMNSICLREVAHMHPTMWTQAIQVTHDALARMFWARELDKVKLFKPNPFNELSALPYDYGRKTHAMVASEWVESGALDKALSKMGEHFDILWEQRNTFSNRMPAVKVCWKHRLQRLVSAMALEEETEKMVLRRRGETLEGTAASTSERTIEKVEQVASSSLLSRATKRLYDETFYYSPFPIAFHGHRAETNEKIQRMFGEKQTSGGATRIYFETNAFSKKAREARERERRELEAKRRRRERRRGLENKEAEVVATSASYAVEVAASVQHGEGQVEENGSGKEEKDQSATSRSPGDHDATTNSAKNMSTNTSSTAKDNRDNQDRTKRSRFTLADVHLIVRGYCPRPSYFALRGIGQAAAAQDEGNRQARAERLLPMLGHYRPLVWSSDPLRCSWPVADHRTRKGDISRTTEVQIDEKRNNQQEVELGYEMKAEGFDNHLLMEAMAA